MSWDHDKYHATCQACGREGFVIESSDDWGRAAREYVGFENLAPDPTAVGRKRQDARQQSGRCACGNSSIRRGNKAD